MPVDVDSWGLRSRSRSLVELIGGCNKIIKFSCADESAVPSR